MSSIGNRLFVNGDITPDVNKTAAFADDDVALVPRKVDITFATARLKQAFIDVIEAPSESTLTIPFVANLANTSSAEVENVSDPGRTPAFLTGPTYWTIQIVSSYQYVSSEDFDSDVRFHHFGLGFEQGGTSWTYGVTANWQFNGYNNECLIFLETMRDRADYSHQPYSSLPLENADDRERTTVVHEIAHVFGCGHGTGGIMGVPSQINGEFQKPEIEIIRKKKWIEKPGA